MTAPSTRTLSSALILVAILALAAHFLEYLRYALAAITYRFEIFDAEGIVWQQAMMIPGPRMYGDINSYPFIVFHYPPLYHLLVNAVSSHGVPALLAGRAISVASALATAATIAALTWRLVGADAGRFARLTGAAVTGLVFFCFFPVIATSPLMRVDMLAVALSFMGLLCFATCGLQSWGPFAGMTFFVLAVFTKQTSIAAPMAAILVTGLIAPRRALALAGFGFLLGVAPLSILMWMTDGGFLRHLVLYNINRFDLSFVWDHIGGQARHFGFVILALAGLAFWWRRFPANFRGGGPGAWREALAGDIAARAMVMITLYLGVSTLMLVGLGKSGATLAYFNELIGILCILTGVLVAMAAAPEAANGAAGGIQMAGFTRVLLPVLLIVQTLVLPASRDFGFSDESQARQSEALVGRIAEAGKPVLSDDMVMLMRAGKQVPWEPAIFAELAALGQWDESHILRMIAARDFAFVITKDTTNFSNAVLGAVKGAYPRVEKTAGYSLHLLPE